MADVGVGGYIDWEQETSCLSMRNSRIYSSLRMYGVPFLGQVFGDACNEKPPNEDNFFPLFLVHDEVQGVLEILPTMDYIIYLYMSTEGMDTDRNYPQRRPMNTGRDVAAKDTAPAAIAEDGRLYYVSIIADDDEEEDDPNPTTFAFRNGRIEIENPGNLNFRTGEVVEVLPHQFDPSTHMFQMDYRDIRLYKVVAEFGMFTGHFCRMIEGRGITQLLILNTRAIFYALHNIARFFNEEHTNSVVFSGGFFSICSHRAQNADGSNVAEVFGAGRARLFAENAPRIGRSLSFALRLSYVEMTSWHIAPFLRMHEGLEVGQAFGKLRLHRIHIRNRAALHIIRLMQKSSRVEITDCKVWFDFISRVRSEDIWRIRLLSIDVDLAGPELDGLFPEDIDQDLGALMPPALTQAFMSNTNMEMRYLQMYALLKEGDHTNRSSIARLIFSIAKRAKGGVLHGLVLHGFPDLIVDGFKHMMGSVYDSDVTTSNDAREATVYQSAPHTQASGAVAVRDEGYNDGEDINDEDGNFLGVRTDKQERALAPEFILIDSFEGTRPDYLGERA